MKSLTCRLCCRCCLVQSFISMMTKTVLMLQVLLLVWWRHSDVTPCGRRTAVDERLTTEVVGQVERRNTRRRGTGGPRWPTDHTAAAAFLHTVTQCSAYTISAVFVRPPGTLVPKAFCFSCDVFFNQTQDLRAPSADRLETLHSDQHMRQLFNASPKIRGSSPKNFYPC